MMERYKAETTVQSGNQRNNHTIFRHFADKGMPLLDNVYAVSKVGDRMYSFSFDRQQSIREITITVRIEMLEGDTPWNAIPIAELSEIVPIRTHYATSRDEHL